jgi:DNA polymerase
MDNTVTDTIITYLKQQAELDIPDYIFSSRESKKNTDYLLPPRDTFDQNSVKEDQGPGKVYDTDKRAILAELYYEVKECKGCALSDTRKKMVFGSGKAAAPLMVIGEAPGYEEDMQGKPFVGRAGELLTRMLAAINLDRDKDIFITNILKCRPPENRNPNQTETVACIPILRRQISIIDPKAILALGRIAAHELLNIKESIGKLRTETHNYNKIPVVITYHPAALLRNEHYKRPAWEDLKKLQEILKEKGVYGNSKNQ